MKPLKYNMIHSARQMNWKYKTFVTSYSFQLQNVIAEVVWKFKLWNSKEWKHKKFL